MFIDGLIGFLQWAPIIMYGILTLLLIITMIFTTKKSYILGIVAGIMVLFAVINYFYWEKVPKKIGKWQTVGLFVGIYILLSVLGWTVNYFTNNNKDNNNNEVVSEI